MLPDLLRTMLDDSGRGDDRRADRGQRTPPAGKPSVLRRRTIRLLALIGIVGIIYGTLMPFQVDDSRTWTWHLAWERFVPSDAVANVLVYIPIGIFVRLLLRRRGSFWLTEWAWSLMLAAGLSYLAEVCQTVLAYRVASWVDVVCNIGGAAIGVALALVFQRVVRNQHAWLYRELRMRPYTAAAAATLILVAVAGLMPFDVHPTPAHLADALHWIQSAPLTLPWTSAADPTVPLAPVQLFDKMAAAAAYALVAFMLVLSVREMGRTREQAALYALTRSLVLAATVEMLQLFTVSHVADPRDLLMAWAFCGLGTAVGSRVCARSQAGLPRPGTVLRGLVMVLALGIVGRAVVAVALPNSNPVPVATSWLPMAGSFHRPWNSLLAHYTTGLFHYAVFAGLLVLWLRASHRQLHWLWVVATTLAAALVGQLLAIGTGQPSDTAQLLLALLAAAMAIRLDRAVFGRRPAIVQTPLS